MPPDSRGCNEGRRLIYKLCLIEVPGKGMEITRI